MSEQPNCKHYNRAGACYLCWHELVQECEGLRAQLATTPPADAPRILADTLKQTDANLRAATDGRLGVRECKPADAALADDALCESLIEASDMRWNGDVYVGDGADLMNLVRAALRARAVPEGFVLVPAGIQSVDRDFEYDASEEMHIPKVVIRFAPGKATDAQTWDGRDKLAWSITQASRALLAASKAGDGGAG